MDEEDESLQSLVIQYLLAHTQCSGCGRSFGPEDMRIRAHRGSVWLAAVTCSHCGLQGLIMATVRTSEAQDSEPLPRADVEELDSFHELGPISSDEVLDWHCFLKQFRGDMRQLLGERSGPGRQ